MICTWFALNESKRRQIWYNGVGGTITAMSPRPYRLGERESAIQQTRDRIIEAARALLTTSDGITSFSIEAVARQANVARMTVYYQFGSRVGLLEAICDTMAA